MGKKVGINQSHQYDRTPEGGITGVTKVKDPPDPGDVAADSAVHEAGKQRHIADTYLKRFGVLPGTNAVGGFEQLHHRRHDMKY